jgi:nitrate/nitrite transporter NarK
MDQRTGLQRSEAAPEDHLDDEFVSGACALGPWVTGVLHDLTGNYESAFWVAMSCSVLSAAAIWLASPRRVRVVGGRLQRQG